MIQQVFGVRLAVMLSSLSAQKLKREEGQTLAEYALILGLIAVVVVAVVVVLGNKITDIFSNVASSV